MFDRHLRALVARPLDSVARRTHLPADAVTLMAFVIGGGAALAIASDHRMVALALWLANRVLDGFDGAVARQHQSSDRGGYVDLVADFAVYAGFIIGVAYAHPASRLAAVVLLGTYYVSGAAFLAYAALAEQRARSHPDNRSVYFVGGLAEGAETVVTYVLLCIAPRITTEVLWIFAALVGITALQRVGFAWRALSDHGGSPDQ